MLDKNSQSKTLHPQSPGKKPVNHQVPASITGSLLPHWSPTFFQVRMGVGTPMASQLRKTWAPVTFQISLGAVTMIGAVGGEIKRYLKFHRTLQNKLRVLKWTEQVQILMYQGVLISFSVPPKAILLNHPRLPRTPPQYLPHQGQLAPGSAHFPANSGQYFSWHFCSKWLTVD